jgi:uncharacterized protein (TIGR03435 family)
MSHQVRRGFSLRRYAGTSVPTRPTAAIALALASALSPAQTQTPQPPRPAFEVASIKPTDPTLTVKMMQLPLNDGRVTIRGLTLKQLIRYAWGNVGVGDGLHASLVAGGPTWVDHDRFDIVAKSEGTRIPSRDERRQMLRDLLIERFQLRLHHESRKTAVYALLVAKNGHTMTTRKQNDGSEPISLRFSGLHIVGRNVPMTGLIDALEAMIPLTDPEREDRPVLDQTGLAGAFDFELAWSGDATFSAGKGPTLAETATAPELFMAVQEQLGLRLKPRKAPMQILIIDDAEKPTPN